jgi:multiple sugar transport system ATP-binding protein
MRLEIARLHRELKGTTIYVTHDQVEAMTLADRIVVLNGGRIEQVGSPLELYHKPANLFVAGFIGSPKMNILPATVASASGPTGRATLPGGGTVEVIGDGLRAGDTVSVGIRPEHLAIGANGDIPGRVEIVEHLGDETLAYVGIGAEAPLTVKAAADSGVAIGDTVRLAVKPGAAITFDSDGRALPRAARPVANTQPAA